MAGENINYINPSSLSEIANRTGTLQGTPDAPNTNPLTGYLQGQAYARMQPFIDLSQQQQEMSNQTQKINLQDLQQQQPSRNFAAINKNISEGTQGQLGTLSNQFAMGRVATDDQVKRLAQQNDIQQQTRALGIDHVKDMASAHDAIADKLGDFGEITPEANEAYHAYLQNRNELVGPKDQITPGHPNWNLTPQIATKLALAKHMITNSPEILGEGAKQKFQTTRELVVNGQQIAFQKGDHQAQRELEERMKKAQLETEKGIATQGHSLQILQIDHVQAAANYSERIQAYVKLGMPPAVAQQKAMQELPPNQRVLLTDDMKARLFPRGYGDASLSPALAGLKSFNELQGTIGAVTPGYQPQQVPNTFGGNPYNPQESGATQQEQPGSTVAPRPTRNIAPPQGVGEIRQFREGPHQWNGRQWVPVRR